MKLLKTSLSIIAIVVSALMVFVSPVSAEEVSDSTRQVEAGVKTKAEAKLCNTIEACKELSVSLQKQTEELEAKGLENLSDDELEHYGKLSNDLLAIQDLAIQFNDELLASLKEQKKEQEKVIMAEKAETADIVKTGQKIAELESILSGQ